MAKFIMNRSGLFDLFNKSTNQCKAIGHRIFSYSVRITAGDKLDKDGFIIDHQIIDNLIQSDVEANSCELIAKSIAISLNELLISEDVAVIEIHVVIKPIGPNVHAYMEYIL
jgi:hypothetical protein